MKLRDTFWLWGHPEGCHSELSGKESRMTPMEFCNYLGIRNVYMVPRVISTPVNIRQYNKSFTSLDTVSWECRDAGFDPAVVEKYIEEAKDFPNFKAMAFDDFVNYGEYQKASLENLWTVRERLHHNEVRPMEMWMVLYTYEFGLDPAKDASFQSYIDAFDGIHMWTWDEKDLPLIPEKFEIFKKLTVGKKRLFGCYLFNFATSQQVSADGVLWQLDWYRERILAGEADGIIFHTNTVGDSDFPAVEAARRWALEHGDEEIG